MRHASPPKGLRLLLTLTLPRINPLMTSAVIEEIHASQGAQLSQGARLLDLSVDLSSIAPQDCPPVSLYRIVLRDRVWLRSLTVARRDQVEVGALLARFSTELDEPLEAAPQRSVRITIAGIVFPPDAWRQAQP
ncbi:MAG TPA: hypothetical protein VMN79_02330 [Casimicrobiaceae bacterium]|nr:hypothetical protein [Casimicrobiaceae bacterium]